MKKGSNGQTNYAGLLAERASAEVCTDSILIKRDEYQPYDSADVFPELGHRLLGRHGRLGLFLLEILDGRLDGVFGQHAAVQFDGWQFEMGGNVGIFDGQDILDRLALDPFRGDTGTGNGRTAAKGFEFGFGNDPVFVHLDL